MQTELLRSEIAAEKRNRELTLRRVAAAVAKRGRNRAKRWERRSTFGLRCFGGGGVGERDVVGCFVFFLFCEVQTVGL